jgi:glycerophosphoryl diester phosphodiesterase
MIPAHPWPRLIGHRGAAMLAPENTLAGFRKAAALGVRAVEFDVRLAADGRAIIMHDDAIDRTTDGSGEAASLTFAAIRRFDAGAWFAPEFRGERVPSLEEAVALLGELGLGAVIELKPAPGAERETGAVVSEILVARWPVALPLVVSSFRPPALEAARAHAPQIDRALLVGTVPADWRLRLEALGCAMLHADAGRLDAATIAAVRASGVPLFGYTVNDPARARRLFARGVAAIFTDCPDRLQAAAV